MTVNLVGGAEAPADDERMAAQAAWGVVAEAFEAALAIPNLSPADRGRFLRCLRKARLLALQPALSTVAGDR